MCHYTQTDGISVQISWCSSVRCWIIGSYNVSVLVSKREDLEKYPGHGKSFDQMQKHEVRYNYCHTIANAWFDLLDKLADHPDIINEQSEFYTVLSKSTLLGEYVGIQEYQQIVNYPKKALVFCSMVENSNVEDTCMLPEIYISFFEKYEFNYTPMTHTGYYQSQDELKSAVLKLSHQVALGKLCEFEEGAIMMLVSRNPSDPDNDRVVSCSKLKTIEYKIFKKIKEKLRHFWAQYEDCSYFSSKMEKEYKK